MAIQSAIVYSETVKNRFNLISVFLIEVRKRFDR